jgi:phage/plasmid primase-like uncharacterized protein
MLGMSRRRDDDERGKIIPIDLNTAGSQDSQPALNTASESLGEVVSRFQDAIEGAGLGRPAIEADGEIHRFDNPKSKSGNKNCWYIFFSDGVPAGHFGAWDENWSEPWSSKLKFEMTPEEWRRSQEQVAYAKEKKAKERALEADKAAQRANDLWTSSAETSEHPYLARKQVGAFGVRTNAAEGTLLIPMRNRYAEIRGVQSIPPQGKKRYLKGVAVDGVFHVIEGDISTVYLCEGYATGASIHMATGAAVAVCFDTGNLPKAALNIREVFPKAKLIVAADDDRWSDRNSGITSANKAAQLVGADVVSPDFQDLSTHPTDFNDLHVLEGLDAVRAQVRGYSVRIKDWSLGALRDQPVPERQWLVEHTIPLGGAMILAAPGGTGKGMLILDLAIKVASDQPQNIDLNTNVIALGNKVCAHGPVVMFSAEDDRDEIHRRAQAMHGGTFPENLYAVCLPDVDGLQAMAMEVRGSLEFTPWWREMIDQIERIKPKLVVLDPLACFVLADLNARQIGASVMSALTKLAKANMCAVIAVHHLNKLKDNVKTIEMAKTQISGSAGFVDHGRGAYVFWPEDDKRAKETCKALDEPFARGKIIRGGLAKANFPGDQEEKVYVRQSNGLLAVINDYAKARQQQREWENLKLLEKAIAYMAEQGHPFTLSGKNDGLYGKRERLPKPLNDIGRDRLEAMGRRLLMEGRIGQYMPAKGSKSEKWLDIPTGPFAEGTGELIPGDWEGMVFEK